jgi:hypothetical protein
MGKGVDIPWGGGSIYHGEGVDIPWVGVEIPWVGGQYTMDRGLICHE